MNNNQKNGFDKKTDSTKFYTLLKKTTPIKLLILMKWL